MINRLTAIKSRNANYLYHMLSVAKVGYDNDYGNKYSSYHDKKDLEVLSRYSELITVRGGEHCGALYVLMFGLPSSLEDSVDVCDYFRNLKVLLSDSYENKEEAYLFTFKEMNSRDVRAMDVNHFLSMFTPLSDIIDEISDVLSRNYQVYMDNIWGDEKKKLVESIDIINEKLSKVDYISSWEQLIGGNYDQDYFKVVLCSAIEGGAEAIDIADDKDIFCVPTNMESTLQLISHEIGVYVMLSELGEVPDVRDYDEWAAFESLSAYLNELVYGSQISVWKGDKKYIEYYKKNFEVKKKDGIRQLIDDAKEYMGKSVV